LLEAHRVALTPLHAISLPPDLSLARSLILDRPQVLEAGLHLLQTDVPVPGQAPIPALGRDGLGRSVLIELDAGHPDRTFLTGLDHLSWLAERDQASPPSPEPGRPACERRLFFILEQGSPRLVRRLGQVRGTWFKLFVARCFEVAGQTCVAFETYASLGEGRSRESPASPSKPRGREAPLSRIAHPDDLKKLEEDARLSDEERAAFFLESRVGGAGSQGVE
jgi:hypothetical protein